MRFLLKIIALPFVLALTILGAAVAFILFLSAWVFYAGAFVIGVGGMIHLFTGDIGGSVGILIIAFILFILPAIAEWIGDRLVDLKYSLQDFILS